jgi:hypothetical protein
VYHALGAASAGFRGRFGSPKKSPQILLFVFIDDSFARGNKFVPQIFSRYCDNASQVAALESRPILPSKFLYPASALSLALDLFLHNDLH